MNIRTVSVIGANGTMGTNVAGIFASFGNTKVYLVSRDLEKSKKAAIKAGKTVKADSIRDNLVPKDYSDLEICIPESDLIFESTSEDIKIKKDVMSKFSKYVKPGTIVCTGSSGLSITSLAECFDPEIRKSFFGVHFFNPPYQLTLCEFIATKYSDSSIYDELKGYLSFKLFRTVVDVSDSPAFLGNRIGFQFINEAMQFAEQYKDNGGIDYIDAILGSYTGRSMAPLVTADFVGLDVHKAIVDNLYENTNDYAHETFVLPQFVDKLIQECKYGRKSNNEGLYKTKVFEDGYKIHLVYDIKTGNYREIYKYQFPFAEEIKSYLQIGEYSKAFKVLISNRSQECDVCLNFLLRYIVYSLYAAKEVSYDISSADDVMATGFTWCPPMALIEAFQNVCDFKQLVRERLDQNILTKVDLETLFDGIKPSKYDYRLFCKNK